MKNSKVTCYEQNMIIPTGLFGYDNPFPIFPETEPVQEPRWIYPYPQHTYQSRKLKNVSYKAVIIENKYLKITILPQMGARIWSCYDKTAKREVFHRNDSILPANMGVGRAYVAGGMEINIPDAHSITNCWPRDCRIIENDDGSITVEAGEWERVYRMIWTVSYTVHALSSRIDISYKINNRGYFPGRFRFWCNPSVAVTQNTELCFPEERADEHCGPVYFSWPVFKGRDLSKFKNIPEVLGLYFLDTRDGWFGAYDETMGGGVVHYANPYMVRGKKLWSWGNSYRSKNRACGLSSPPCYYVEIQSGRIISQDYYEGIRPQECLAWQETWFPVGRIGGISKSTDKLTVSLKKIKEKTWAIGLQTNELIKEVSLKICDKNHKPLFSRDIGKLSPDKAFLTEINLSTDDNITLFVYLSGKEHLSFTPRNHQDPGALKKEKVKIDENFAEACYLRGEFHENNGELSQAHEWYQKSLNVDKNYTRTLVALGRMLLRGGSFDESEKYFSQALGRDELCIDAYYYSALGCFFADNLVKARARIDQSLAIHPTVEAGTLSGQIESKSGHLESAVDRLEWALDLNRKATKPMAMLISILRHMGDNKKASELLKTLLKSNPIEPLGQTENYLTGENIRRTIIGLNHDFHRLMEAAADYINMGFYEDAINVLTLYIDNYKLFQQIPPQQKLDIPPRFQKKDYIYPMAYYLAGYAWECSGNLNRAAKEYLKADKADPTYGFPNRLEEYKAIESAIKINTTTPSSYYYLGNFLFYNRRLEEGIKAWEKSIKYGFKRAEVFRNCGLAEWRLNNKPEAAFSFYRKALTILPNEHNLVAEVFRLPQNPRLKEKIARLVLLNEGASYDMLLLGQILDSYASLKWWDELDRFIKSCKFPEIPNWYYQNWKNAMLGKMKWLIAKGQYKEALQCSQITETPPANIGGNSAPPSYKIETHSDLHFLEGLIYEKLGDDKKARIMWEKSASENLSPCWFEEEICATWRARMYQFSALRKLGRAGEANMVWEGIRNYFMTNNMTVPPTPEEEIANEGKSEKAGAKDADFKTPEN